MPGNLTSADFAQHLNETFRISADALPGINADLVDVSDLPDRDRAGTESLRRRPFSLVCRGPPDRTLAQGIFTVEHDEMGSFDLFLVPIGPDDRGMRYEAVFT